MKNTYKFKILTDTSSINCMLESKTLKKNREYAQERIPIKKGRYLISLSVDNVRSVGFINVSNKEDYILIGDSLFYSERSWRKYDGGANLHGEGCLLSFGYDGEHYVKVKIEKIDYTPKDEYKEAVILARNLYKEAKKIKLNDIYQFEIYKKSIENILFKFKRDKVLKKYYYSTIISDIYSSINLLKLSSVNKLASKIMKEIENKEKN